MKKRSLVLISLGVIFCVMALLFWALLSAPRSPIALLRVVDASGKPVAGAIIKPEGMRTKAGPYVSGWYSWDPEICHVQNTPVKTGADGYALVPYPKYVFEHIETGTLCLEASHSNFVTIRPECVVAIALPAGAPWRARLNEVWGRIQHRSLIAHADPIVLQHGASLKISTRSTTPSGNGKLFAQISGSGDAGTNFWERPESGVLFTRRLAKGSKTVRAFELNTNGSACFSDLTNITSVIGQTNELVLDLKPGHAIHGQLDAKVPRPVVNGRAIVQIWPFGESATNSPPFWHAWSAVRGDGSFDIPSLPSGDVELIVICQGFISTNGPGKFKMRYPQKFQLDTNDLDVVIGMEPTARLLIHVTDDKNKPLKGVTISAWPNVRYGEWWATVVASDCYNLAEQYLKPEAPSKLWLTGEVPDFNGASDDSGVAILSNLPVDVREINAQNGQFVLPAIDTGSGQKERYAVVTLQAGASNEIYLQLEPRGQSLISHY